jgi:O-antigen/teichoic acid export membrane protein
VRSALFFGLSQGVSWIGGAALTVLLPRYLGDVRLGKLGFALALVALASLVSNLGTATHVTKEIARDPSRAANLTACALVSRLPLSLAAATLSVAFVHLLPYDATTRELVALLSLWILADSISGIVLGALLGLQRTAALAVIGATTNSVYALVAAAMLLHGGGPLQVAAAYVLSQVTAAAVGLTMLIRHVRPRLSPAAADWRALITGGLPYFMWQAALLIYGQIDSVLLSLMTNDAVVGWYVAAYRLVSIPSFVPVIVTTIVFPALAAASRQPARFNLMARRALHLTLLLTLPMSVGILLLAGRLTQLLGYPPEFLHSIEPIQLLVMGVPLIAADMVIGTMLNTMDRQRQWALAGVAAAILNPLANLAVIPICQVHLGNGAIGAAAVTTGTEMFMMVIGLWLLPRRTLDSSTLALIAKCVLASAAMAAVIIPLRHSALPVVLVVGAASYAAAALGVGALTVADLREAARQLLPERSSARAESSATSSGRRT